MLRWVDAAIMPWLALIFEPPPEPPCSAAQWGAFDGESGGRTPRGRFVEGSCDGRTPLGAWQARLRFFLLQALGHLPRHFLVTS